MRTIYLSILLFSILGSKSAAQTADQVRKFFETQNFDSVIICGKAVIEQHKDEFDTYLFVGRACNFQFRFAEAIPYLEKAKSLNDAPDWVHAWAMCELGVSYYATGDKKLSSENLSACMKLNATPNSNKTALRYTWIFGFDSYYSMWQIKESRNFIFHFQDTEAKKDKFIERHQSAFDSLSHFFNCTLSHKIDFYVWTNDTDQIATTMMGHLAFSRPQLFVTHSSIGHSLAHEIMHHILFCAFPDAKKNQLITEGTCVYFDVTGPDNFQKLKTEKNISSVNIRDCLEHNKVYPDKILYPLGGELVKRIFEKFGKEKFMTFMNDQSLDNARKIFGKELDPLIDKLEADIKGK